MDSELVRVVTFSIAVLGAVLGVLNFWNAVNQRRVKLRVRPRIAIGHPNGQELFVIEATNLSAFPLTIAEVGFMIPDRWFKQHRMAVPAPIIMDGGSWPRRLEARSNVSAYFGIANIVAGTAPVGRAYVRTECGEVRYGTSPVLRDLQRKVQASIRARRGN